MSYLRELVRKTVRETLNVLFDEGAGKMVDAERYKRTAGHEACRSRHCKLKLVTASGEVMLDVPKLCGATLYIAVIECFRRRETGVEDVVIEMRPAGISTQRMEDFSETLRGVGVSVGTVTGLEKKAFESVGGMAPKTALWRMPKPHRQRYPPRSEAGAASTRTSPR